MVKAGPPANPKVRGTGLVLIVLAVLAYLGSFAGVETSGTATRIALGVVGTVLLLLGVALLRTRTPRVDAVDADAHGLRFRLAGAAPETVPWNVVRDVQMPTLSPILGGHMLRFEIAPGATCPARLRVFGQPQPGGATRILIGLTSEQAARLQVTLPAHVPQPPPS